MFLHCPQQQNEEKSKVWHLIVVVNFGLRQGQRALMYGVRKKNIKLTKDCKKNIRKTIKGKLSDGRLFF